MTFTKVVKNKAYFKRFQTKYRRRREGKTDYYARKRLITQAKNKYNSPKYRFVVRFSNKNITCQIIYAKIQGDVVICCANSHELPKYGITHGLTNWAAAYSTGLLLARRLLTSLKLDSKYEGQIEADGEYFKVEPLEDGPRPFKAFLDAGLRRTTTGSRMFGALKGAVDGGLDIPYSDSRFPGYDRAEKKADVELLNNYIYGIHVQEYMEYLIEEDDEAYKRQFARYIEDGIEPDSIEDLYRACHEKIRAEPQLVKSTFALDASTKTAFKKFKMTATNYKQKKNRVQQKITAFKRQLAASAESDE